VFIDGEIHRGEKKIFTDKGEKFMQVTASPIKDARGNVLGAIEMVRDITDKKMMAIQLQQAHDELENRVAERTEELRAAYRKLLHTEKLGAIGNLTSSLVHELGNPIFAFRNLFESLNTKKQLAGDDHKMIRVALDECSRIKELIEGLKDFSRPSAGTMEPVDVHLVLEELLLIFRKKFENKKIQISKKYSQGLPPSLMVKDQLKQVLLNLLKNAEEAIPARGGAIRIKTEGGRESILISIHNTGKTIPHQDINKIFEPFFTTKGENGGTGLGLSISYGIIKKHGGKIEVKSKAKHGTTFELSLPTVVPALMSGENNGDHIVAGR
jgi:signal transduction histidine kinase